jgi:hypothetical protein
MGQCTCTTLCAGLVVTHTKLIPTPCAKRTMIAMMFSLMADTGQLLVMLNPRCTRTEM